jgi:hypothetical protein
VPNGIVKGERRVWTIDMTAAFLAMDLKLHHLIVDAIMADLEGLRQREW